MDDYRDPEWVAQKLGIDKNTVYKYLQDGMIPALQLGHKWLVSESRLEAWLDEETQRQTQARREAKLSTQRTVRRMDNYSPAARQAISAAHSEARRYCHNFLGQEHLLLALAADPDCPAARALADWGLDGPRLREQFERRFRPGQLTPPRRLARTEEAKLAMRLAARQAQARHCDLVGPEHILMGILQSRKGPGYDWLVEQGIPDDTIAAFLAASPQPEPPSQSSQPDQPE